MAKKKPIPEKYRRWIEARNKHKLSHAQIQMARELGMDPKNLRKLDNHKQEPWKLPLGQFIEQVYRKRFGKLPDKVVSIEQKVKAEQKKRAERRARKQLERETKTSSS